MSKTLFLGVLMSTGVVAGPYIEIGVGVPLSPDSGYIPDQYGIASIGYITPLNNIASVSIAFDHRSLTGSDYCHGGNCNGDNAIAAKLRFEW